jgi:sugar lactone lactonase YvrE
MLKKGSSIVSRFGRGALGRRGESKSDALFNGEFEMAAKQETALKPAILTVDPVAAIAGGELRIRGSNFSSDGHPAVTIGEEPAPLMIAADDFVLAKVPEAAMSGEIVVHSGKRRSAAWEASIGVQIADSLHPVANPAVDSEGNVFSTFSGTRGQRAPVSIYKIDSSFTSKPFVSDLMNPTGLAFDREGLLYASNRFDGIVYQITPTGNMSVFVEGMGVATGLAFDKEGNLYLGDRSGTIFKISRSRQIYVFATLEPSIAAYHLAFSADGNLYVTGPTTSSFDSVYRINPAGEVETVFRGLGRPQGLAFDADGNLYVAASLAGRRGIVQLKNGGNDPSPRLFLSGPNIVGLAFAPGNAIIIATQSALYRVEAGVRSRVLP